VSPVFKRESLISNGQVSKRARQPHDGCVHRYATDAAQPRQTRSSKHVFSLGRQTRLSRSRQTLTLASVEASARRHLVNNGCQLHETLMHGVWCSNTTASDAHSPVHATEGKAPDTDISVRRCEASVCCHVRRAFSAQKHSVTSPPILTSGAIENRHFIFPKTPESPNPSLPLKLCRLR
jgi:hypothetical protein